MMIDSQKILYSEGNNDECYTPSYAVLPILKFIPKNWTVWCPFDTEDSEYVKLIKANGNKVIASHINNNQDFHTYQPNEHWDCMISNPQFTDKRKTFERALSFGKPFALLMSLTWLNDKYSKWVFKEADREMQLLMFDKRIKFLNNGVIQNKITFSSGYYCSDFLPKQIIIEELIL